MRFLFCMLLCLFVLEAYPDNLRFDKGVKIISVTPDAVELEIKVLWSNSWRNVYNYDAVYLFGKYRSREGQDWHHVVFAGEGNRSLTDGYDVVKGTKGLWIYRNATGQGYSSLNVRVKWLLRGNPDNELAEEDIREGKVFFSFEGLEMVFVPSAPFFPGQAKAAGGIDVHTFGGIPAGYDIIGTNPGYVYSAATNNSWAAYAAARYNDAVHNPSNIRNWSGVVPTWWKVDFRTPKEILYFGVSGEYNQLSVPATEWYLQGSATGGNNDNEWKTLWQGGKEFWSQSYRSYPVQRAIRVTAPGAYRYYRIRILDSDRSDLWNDVRICNVAMTEADLSALDSLPVPVDRNISALFSPYPSGFQGFYAMKYELTQEQYVVFLNHLPRSAQYTRTIGGRLDGLKEGSYVFGGTPERPSHRNGIVVRKRETDSNAPYLFGCDLNPRNTTGSLDDGQALACNYLSPSDMLAYADWCGLRPLSELEFEKMCSPVFPQFPVDGAKAWQTADFKIGSNLTNEGRETETLGEGNVNASGAQDGPVRAAAFVRSGKDRVGGGLSYWGFGELSGNLAEIYYNAGVYGRQFNAGIHGDGKLAADGRTDVPAVYWADRPDAFGVRGGSFASAANELEVADRSRAENYFSTIDERRPDIGFRLGYSAGQQDLAVELVLENGKKSGGTLVYDTVCDNRDYCIRGNIPVAGRTPCSYIWYVSEDGETSWKILPGQNGRDLRIKELSRGVLPNTIGEYRYKRLAVSPAGVGESGTVALTVGRGYMIDRLCDTVQPCMETKGFKVVTPLPATFEWWLLESGKTILAKEETPVSSSCRVYMDDLKENGNGRPSGRYALELKIKVANRCVERQALNVSVIPYTRSPFSGQVVAYAYDGGDAYPVGRLWGGDDRQKWMLDGKNIGTLVLDDTTGILHGMSGTLLKDISIRAVCEDYPDQAYRVKLQEAFRDIKYTGDAQPVILFPGVYTMECRGAQAGMYSSGNAGPAGGYTRGIVELHNTDTLYIYAGQMGYSYAANQTSPAPYNGGGQGYGGGGDGGGATDIRLEGGEWDNPASLRSRIMVAAGGGGSDQSSLGGFGGGITGGSALYTQSGNPGYGAAQTSAGQRPGIQQAGGFGYGGGTGTGIDGGGGGGGWYGGSSGNNGHDGGGGGSSFISGYPLCDAVDKEGNHTHQPVHYSGLKFSDPLMIKGQNKGNGSARITVERLPLPEESPGMKTIKDFGTYRAWSDGTFACSAEEYRHPRGTFSYSGDTGDGIYRIDPDGNAGSQQPFDVYCDMTTGGGGWTLVAAQYENNPVSWSQGIQGNYDPSLNTKRSFALGEAQLPPHTYTAFGKDFDPVYVGYSQMAYSTGDIGLWTVKNLKTDIIFHVHRAASYYFSSHDPESGGGNTYIWNNTLTYDQSGGVCNTWAFSPQNSTEINRGYSMLGYTGNLSDDFAWTVWVK